MMSADAQYPSRASARFAQFTLACVAIVAAMDAVIVGLLIEPMKHDLRLNDVQLGVANTTVYFLAYGLLSPPAGMLVDRIDRTHVLLGAALLFCIALTLTAFAFDYHTLLLSKALMGAAFAAVMPAALSLYADYFPPERRALAIVTFPLGQVVGSSAGILIGGQGFALASKLHVAGVPIMDLAPWRVVFLFFAALAVLLIPMLIALREPKRLEVAQQRVGSLRQLWIYRGALFPLFTGQFFITGLSSGVVTWVAPALMRLYGKQPGDFAGWYGAVQLIAGLAGVLAAGRLAELVRRKAGSAKMLLPAALGALVCAPATCMALAPSELWFAIALAVFLLAYNVTVSITLVAVTFRVPNELRGFATGFFVIFSAIGASFVSPVIAQVSGLLGGESAIGQAMGLVGAILALSAAACFWVGSRTSPARFASGPPPFGQP